MQNFGTFLSSGKNWKLIIKGKKVALFFPIHLVEHFFPPCVICSTSYLDQWIAN